ncbi:hypothetical protein F5Y00DRAFT_272512 [Daldinia vernicosa]|uniref:uncharacterized protein n=1 Tax=Daldinia vernicosa TaxID=114800 RepID=UPI002007FEEB|nr:uncharacterized protein F5Y00DRAFT_272512 [Daldinia vernicosa]KAI0852922.1 hypothetical protein F5Y00DRAFT_272512 [Daldinia vernicosa]
MAGDNSKAKAKEKDKKEQTNKRGSANQKAEKVKKRPPPLDLSAAKVEDDDEDDQRPNTGDSVYSCSGLDPGHKLHYLNAKDVRRQVQNAPSGQLPGTKYATTFHNREDLPNLKSTIPRLEFPLRNDGSSYRRGAPGPVRAIYNEDPEDRTNFDVVYHTTTDRKKHGKDLDVAKYRPSSRANADSAP